MFTYLASFIQANIFYGEIKWSLSSYITNLCRMWTVLQPLYLQRLLLTTKNCRIQRIQPGSKQTNRLPSFWTLLFLRRLPLKLLDFLLLHRSGMLSKTRIATLRLNVYTVYVINFASWSKEPLLFLILAANLRPYVISYQPLDTTCLWIGQASLVSFLGASFETFSTAIRASKPHPSFRNLLSQAESHEVFLTSLHCSTSTSPVAFLTDHSRPPYTSRGRGRSSRRGGCGRGHRTPHCQLWLIVIMLLTARNLSICDQGCFFRCKSCSRLSCSLWSVRCYSRWVCCSHDIFSWQSS